MTAVCSFRPATEADALFVASRLRDFDRKEGEALGLDPAFAAKVSFIGSDCCIVGCIDGVPAMLFGLQLPPLEEFGTVWALGTDAAGRNARLMLEQGRIWIRKFLEVRPKLVNEAYAGNPRTLAWLKRLGVTVGKPRPFGPKGELFCHIVIEKGV